MSESAIAVLCRSSGMRIFVQPFCSLFNVTNPGMMIVSHLVFWLSYIPIRKCYGKFYQHSRTYVAEASVDSWLPNSETLFLTVCVYYLVYYLGIAAFLSIATCPAPTAMEIAKESDMPLPIPDETLPMTDFSTALQS